MFFINFWAYSVKVRCCNQCSWVTVFILTKENQNSAFAIDHFTTEIVDHAQKIS